MTRYVLALCSIFVLALVGCDDNGSDEGSGEVMVGSACTDDGQCPGPGTPDCIEDGIYPLLDMANSDSGLAQDLADIGIDLPGGYCSTVPPCTTDAECGLGGACFFPLRDVDEEVWDSMMVVMQEKFGLTDDELATVAAFYDFGQCLRPCEDNGDCKRDGYVCVTPLSDLLALVTGSDKSTFCIGEETVE